MTIDDDIALLEFDSPFISPLDRPEEEALPRPDPEIMMQLLHSDQVLERMQAARAFCEVEEPRAIARLIELLHDDCPLVRVSAAYALGRNYDDSVIQPLVDQLEQDWNGYVRKGVVWALGNCRDRRAPHPLVSALKYDISAVRLWAASALGQLGDVAAIPVLTEALDRDRVAAIRGNCAWALGKLTITLRRSGEDNTEVYREAVDALVNGLYDEDLGVQADARTAVRKLGDPRGLKVLEKIEIEQGYCEF